MQTWLIIYCVFSTCIFLYGLHTALEDVTIMRHTGEPGYPDPPGAFIGGLLVLSFIPFLNVLLLGFTMFYRRGHL